MKKKTAMIISFAVGSILFATSAFAEVASKSGYEQLKDGIKYTADSCANKLQSYTFNLSVVVRDNGNIIESHEGINKYDVSKNARENTSVNVENTGKKYTDYYYSDKNCSISYNSDQDMYFENDFTSTNNEMSFSDPFKEKQAGDIEKIADALIGNLKDYVVVKQNPDGSKELSGSLSESQIPALINAVASYEIKNQFGGYRAARIGINDQTAIPKITKDVFVKEVKGNMILNKDGLIQSVLGTGIISGKDDNGKEHSLSLELLGKLTDVNSTTVKRPDLTDKKVQKSTENVNNTNSNPEIFVGQYKNDIVIVKDNKFVKIGERFVDVAHSDKTGIAGRYHEEFLKGYEDYAANKKDFRFDAKFSDKDKYNAEFSANISGNTIKGNICTPPGEAMIYFNIDEPSQGIIFNGNFSRVFN